MPKRVDDELSFTIPGEATTGETRSRDSSSDRTASCAIAEKWTDGLVLHVTAGDGGGGGGRGGWWRWNLGENIIKKRGSGKTTAGGRCVGFERGEEAMRGWNRRIFGTVAVEKRGFVHREDDQSCPTNPFSK